MATMEQKKGALEDKFDAEAQLEAAASNAQYDKTIKEVGNAIQDQIKASKDWANTQKKNQQAQTDFAIEQINQQKDQAEADYIKEQSGAYKDWQKQSNPYGVNAEKMAAQGLQNTGYSESAQVSMYNQYQNRVMAAREAYTRAVLNYDNAIKDARLQNNSVLAEIAYKALQSQLELSLQGVVQKHALTTEKMQVGRDIKNTYHDLYLKELSALYQEETLAENKRQFDETMKFEKAKFAWEQALLKDQKSSGGSSGGGGGGGGSDTKSNDKTDSEKKIKDTSGNDNKSGKEALLTKAQSKTFRSSQAVKAFLNSNGISVDSSLVLSFYDWDKGKKMGVDTTEFKYNTYNDYLKGFVMWSIMSS